MGKADQPQILPVPAVSAAIFRGLTETTPHILLIERGGPPYSGVWSLPGGHIEPGEKARDAAHRELREETGISAHIRSVVDIVDVVRRDPSGELTQHFVIASYAGLWRCGEPRAGSDARQAAWIAIDSLGEHPLTPGAANVIRQAWDALAPA